MHYVYCLRSESNPEKVYIGESEDIESRLEGHNSDKNTGWTRHFPPWRIEAYVLCDNQDTALVVEAFFKNDSGQEKFRNFEQANPQHPNPRQGFFDTLAEGTL